MIRSFFITFLIIPAVWLTGCEQSKRSTAQTAFPGIKISDIAPTFSDRLGPQIVFQIFTFEFPAQRVLELERFFANLRLQPFRFVNYKAFKANGFSAGFGRGREWNSVAEQLRRTEAQETSTNTLIVFDNKGDAIGVVWVDAGQTIFYFGEDGSVASLSPGMGRLILQLKAEPVPEVRGATQVVIQPVFRQGMEGGLGRLAGRDEFDEKVFSFARFTLKMSDGDFVLLGPSEYKKDKTLLSDLFFTGRGNFLVRKKPPQQEKQKVSAEDNYVLQRNIPLVRMYLIVCMKVGD